jgi:hypothetical protein
VLQGEPARANSRTWIRVATTLAALASVAGCAPRKRTAIVVQVQSDMSRADVQSALLTVQGVRADGTLVELDSGRSVATATSGNFPGNVLVNFAEGMVAAQVTIEVTPRVGAPFAHRSRASFVREQWRTYSVFLASQCSSAAVQLQCSSMSGGGVEFVCGSADPANPCVPVEQRTTQNYEPAQDAGVFDATVTDVGATVAVEASAPPGIVPGAIAPWTGARLSSGTVEFRWRLSAGATQGRVALCSDYACSAETMSSAIGATSATMTIAPGRYAYRVTMLDAAGVALGYTAPRPFEVLATRAARAVAVGTSMHVNPVDFDRDFAVGTRTQSMTFRQVSVIGDTFALPISAQLTAQPDFGRSIANLGDFNGDGFSEVLVASQAARDTAVRAPAMLLRTPNVRTPRAFDFANVQFNHRDLTIAHPAWAVAGGDVNGDGFSDMVIGAPSNDGTNGTTTVIYGYDGPTSANLATAASTTVTSNSPAFGGAVVSGCDFDGDGFADFAVSSVSLDAMDMTPRPVRVFFGGAAATFAEVTVEPPASLPNGASARRWGSTLACGADLDGDGLGDLAISDIAASAAGVRVGAITAWSVARRAALSANVAETASPSEFTQQGEWWMDHGDGRQRPPSGADRGRSEGATTHVQPRVQATHPRRGGRVHRARRARKAPSARGALQLACARLASGARPRRTRGGGRTCEAWSRPEGRRRTRPKDRGARA